MKVSKRGLAEIASHEGIVQMPYKDSVGVWTWGIGHTRYAGDPDPAKMTKGVARPMGEVMAQFVKDIAKYERGVDNRIGGANVKQHEYDAAVSFHYNTGAIARASWVSYWVGRKLDTARARILYWNKPPEIIGRRRKEADLFRHGKYGDGYATVYPAYASGRVNWSKGRRVNVLQILEDGKPSGPVEQGPDFKPLSHYQQRLADLGFDPGPIDNKWGKRTSAAVKKFQRTNGGLVVDGILGPLTSQAIDQAYADRPEQVAVASSAVGIATVPVTLMAGFSWPQVAVLVGVAAAVYAVWHFRSDIKERILTWIG
ncbi:glycoside hydrolase family protein [Methyloceanibacter caenitepidi]|uniref:Lysozyme n=1 Tax=Methyloceanibacter caenitepidi TaxID=1384459 RepID=A0A0A8K6Z9_9HYPH|nr:peptidoglycan-binding protein [Methyloceanibacter caenitepidi]BAQ18287.1 hypothetical protein GL4_2854 [Methyloceanibacter caenitepidi]